MATRNRASGPSGSLLGDRERKRAYPAAPLVIGDDDLDERDVRTPYKTRPDHVVEEPTMDDRIKYVYNVLSKVRAPVAQAAQVDLPENLAYAVQAQSMGSHTVQDEHMVTFHNTSRLEELANGPEEELHVIVAEDTVPAFSLADESADGAPSHRRMVRDSSPTANAGDYVLMDNFGDKVTYVYQILKSLEERKPADASGPDHSTIDEQRAYHGAFKAAARANL